MVEYQSPESVRSVAVLGSGTVGASWAALFLAHDIDVVAFDHAENAPERTQTYVTNAWPSLVALGVTRKETPPLQKLRFSAGAEDAAAAADVIQENLPEIPELKLATLKAIDACAGPFKIILSSTGGIPPTQLQSCLAHPERLVVLHPFNPAHLMPLVEVVGGQQTSQQAVAWAMDFARRLGKEPIKLNAEANGHMTNRLQFALIREAVACLLEGMASAEDIEKAVRYGLAPRWVLMGSLLSLHLAGGAGGMKGILDHAGLAIEEWWTPSSVPPLDAQLRDRLVEAATRIAQGASVDEWVRWRNRHLVDVIKLQTSRRPEGV
jgi:carnitine 3-dehydrogenase